MDCAGYNYMYFQNSLFVFDNVYGEVLDLEFAILEKRLCPQWRRFVFVVKKLVQINVSQVNQSCPPFWWNRPMKCVWPSLQHSQSTEQRHRWLRVWTSDFRVSQLLQFWTLIFELPEMRFKNVSFWQLCILDSTFADVCWQSKGVLVFGFATCIRLVLHCHACVLLATMTCIIYFLAHFDWSLIHLFWVS